MGEHGIFRFESDRLVDIGQSAGIVAGLLVAGRTVLVIEPLRIEPDRRTIIGNRSGVVSRAHAHNPLTIVRLGVVGIGFKRFVEGLRGGAVLESMRPVALAGIAVRGPGYIRRTDWLLASQRRQSARFSTSFWQQANRFGTARDRLAVFTRRSRTFTKAKTEPSTKAKSEPSRGFSKL
jgi:hypothetical protein